jgi:N-acetylmuramoyl-L-alanine amidase
MICDSTRDGNVWQTAAMSMTGFALSLFALPSAASATQVTGINIEDRAVTIRFDGAVERATSFQIPHPDRIAVDIGGADPGKGRQGYGMVESVRQGRQDSHTTRIVLDLKAPAVVTGGGFSADGRSLTLRLAPVASNGFADTTASKKIFRPAKPAMSSPPRSRYNLTVPLEAAKSGLPTPKIFGPKGRPLIVIDAGHGGHDPGAISPFGSRREKDVTLAVAKAVRDEIIAAGRFRVALTRDDDKYLILRERSALARRMGAELFISIHADSAGEGASGSTIYTLSEVASDREAQLLAQRENKADLINGVNIGSEKADIASILVDLAQRETMNASANFASLLKREAGPLMNLRPDYHRMAGFAVLKSPDMPSVLIEIGYLTNQTDVERLFSGEGQRRIATGLRKAIDVHFSQRSAMR